nr:sugar phosphate nucleotidyltransferase [Evansella caseinilytica]
MKGVVLAGGRGTRLSPFTKVINKHLLPVGKYPMIYWPLLRLQEAKVTNVCIVTSEESIPAMKEMIEALPLEKLSCRFVPQAEPLGIADGILQAEPFVKNDKIVVLLGDNVFTDSLHQAVEQFIQSGEGAKVFVKEVSDPERYGVVEIDDRGNVLNIEEKPLKPKTNLCATGIYLYDNKVFDYIRRLSFSTRGEMEVTDLNRQYLEEGKLTVQRLESFWIDAGTIASLNKANSYMFNPSE